MTDVAQGASRHQYRLVRRRVAYVRVLAHANRALSHEECEDIVAQCLAEDAAALPARLSWSRAHRWFSARVQMRAIDYLRSRDGRRPGERERRLKLVSLDLLMERDGSDALPLAVADPDADAAVVVEAEEERREVESLARVALSRLSPAEQRVLRVRAELPEATIAELAERLRLTVPQFEHRLRSGRRKLARAVAGVRMTEQCTAIRALLADGFEHAEPSRRVQVDAHLEGCWACRLWRHRDALPLMLPFPAFSRLEWIAARIAGLVRPELGGAEGAAGAGLAGGSGAAIGTKLAALCLAGGAVGVCVGTGVLPEPLPGSRGGANTPMQAHRADREPRRGLARRVPIRAEGPIVATPTSTPTPKRRARRHSTTQGASSGTVGGTTPTSHEQQKPASPPPAGTQSATGGRAEFNFEQTPRTKPRPAPVPRAPGALEFP